MFLMLTLDFLADFLHLVLGFFRRVDHFWKVAVLLFDRFLRILMVNLTFLLLRGLIFNPNRGILRPLPRLNRLNGPHTGVLATSPTLNLPKGLQNGLFELMLLLFELGLKLIFQILL